MKRFRCLLLAFLLSACVPKSDMETALQRVATLEAQSTAQAGTISDQNREINELSSENSDLQSELSSLQESYSALEGERDELQSKYDDARSSVTNLTSQLSKLNKLICDEQIEDMKYENILDASTILAAWWARQPGVERVQGTYRDTIWSNADTKIHAIRYIASEDHKPYVEHFLVYFREFGMKPAVFWVGGQCWLDAP